MATIAVSGGFDPVHPGHIAMFYEALRHGDVVVILNSDEWLIRKKGYRLMDWSARRSVLMSLRPVSNVVAVDDTDGTVCQALRTHRLDFFANGGDRGEKNTPELELCRQLNIVPLFGVGGTNKPYSSSDMVRAAIDRLKG